MNTTMLKEEKIQGLVFKAKEGDKFSIAKLISLFENTKSEYIPYKKEVIQLLSQHSTTKGFFIGITGTPGVGKSSLIGRITIELLQNITNKKIAILAVDPSSEISGGSLLGDRTRLRLPYNENRIYFRSQASDKELGGLGRHTFDVCRILYYLFDLIFIETVGIGQSEIEIKKIADYLFLVLQPLTGDQIQFMKAGVMEVPDAFIINKWDEKNESYKTYYALQTSLNLITPNSKEIPVFPVSSHTGYGIDMLVEFIIKISQQNPKPLQEKEKYFFYKWVQKEYGNKGIEILNQMGGIEKWFTFYPSLDLAIEKFSTIKYVYEP